MRSCLIFFITAIASITVQAEYIEDLDDHDQLIAQYFTSHQTKVHSHRHTRDCQHISYGNVTNSKQYAHGAESTDIEQPFIETRHVIKPVGFIYNQRFTHIRLTKISYPLRTLSVLEPKERGGCNDQIRVTVAESALQKNCLVAINAGFFNTHNGSCLGNVISNGRIVMDSGGVQNAHFGITKDGHLFFGYLSEIDLVAEQFQQLVGGVIWIIRDGKNHIQESLKIECQDTQETGTLDQFANVLSARTVVGSDKDGHVVLFQVDGKTHSNGMTLYELADVLLEYGFVNAINLDGGGSTTNVIYNTLVNYPTDTCTYDKKFNCARNVSTILCVHEAECSPFDCSGHGICRNGKCICNKFWTGPHCDHLNCPHDCSQHGICTKDGCQCNAGRKGDSCSVSCPAGYYGKDCVQQCSCSSGSFGACDPVSGKCQCKPGFTGDLCQNDCAIGFYGNHCLSVCMCSDGCPCHPETGSCDFSKLTNNYMQVGTCYAKQQIKRQHLVPDRSNEFRSVTISLICISIFAGASAIINIIFICKLCTRKEKQKRKKVFKKSKSAKNNIDGDYSENEMSSFSEYPMVTTSFSKSAKDY